MAFPIIWKTFLTPLHLQTHTKLNWMKLATLQRSYPWSTRKLYPQASDQTSKCIPWITHAIKLKMKERKQLYGRARETQTHESWEAYYIIAITQEISEAHTNCQIQIFENNICTVSKIFRKFIKAYGKIMLEFLPWQQMGS